LAYELGGEMGCKLGRKLGVESGSWSDQVLGGVLDIWREPGSACVWGVGWGMEWACESGVESDAVWACESGSWSDSGSDPLLAQAWGGE